MEFNIDFNLIRSQKLLLIPQLKQAIEILEMNSHELFHYVENQLEANPALEEEPDNAALEELSNYLGTSTVIDPDQDQQINDRVSEAERVLSLKQHLLLQLDALCLDKNSYIIGEYLIDNTDDNGYMKADINETAVLLDTSEGSILKVLKKLQSLDPPGICARDLKECLLIQLSQFEEPDRTAMVIVDRHLDAVANDDAESVACATGMHADRIREVFGRIKNLEPKPGREYYSNETVDRTLPDIIIQDTKGDLQVVYNEEAFPNVCISEVYAKKSAIRYTDDNGRMHKWLNNAVWLIKCLEQREDIIFSIAQKICDFRREFFNKGPKALKLIDKRSFASSLYLHESILDKAIEGKYLQCRWGTFEFRSFFKEA